MVESPDAGDDLIIECRNELTSSWMELDRQPSNDPDIYYYESRSVLLAQHMLKAGFKLRIRTVGNRWDWFIDDVMIKGQREMTTDSIEPVVVDDTDDRISETASFSELVLILNVFPPIIRTKRFGAAVLAYDDPSKVLCRSAIPILSPREYYERVGAENNVVFSCGAILEDDGQD